MAQRSNRRSIARLLGTGLVAIELPGEQVPDLPSPSVVIAVDGNVDVNFLTVGNSCRHPRPDPDVNLRIDVRLRDGLSIDRATAEVKAADLVVIATEPEPWVAARRSTAPNAAPPRWGTWAPPTREPDTVPWLFISIALSVVLTVFVNVGLRAFPDASRRVARRVTKLTAPTADETRTSDRRVRVWVPWKAMIVGSVILTIVVNLVLWIARG